MKITMTCHLESEHAPSSESIAVSIERINGRVTSCATSATFHLRCLMTSDLRARWEVMIAGKWKPIEQVSINLHWAIRSAMRRAAGAGLVYCGAVSIW